MRLPKLQSEDISGLRKLYHARRHFNKCWDTALPDQLAGLTITRDATYDELRKLATVNALAWFDNAPHFTLEAELHRWWATLKWEQTTRGWRAFRLITSRRVYAKSACITMRPEKPAIVYVRLTGRATAWHPAQGAPPTHLKHLQGEPSTMTGTYRAKIQKSDLPLETRRSRFGAL